MLHPIEMIASAMKHITGRHDGPRIGYGAGPIRHPVFLWMPAFAGMTMIAVYYCRRNITQWIQLQLIDNTIQGRPIHHFIRLYRDHMRSGTWYVDGSLYTIYSWLYKIVYLR